MRGSKARRLRSQYGHECVSLALDDGDFRSSHCRGTRSMLNSVDTDAVVAAWARVQTALPQGWIIDSLRCASEGLDAEQRSDDWIAVAVGPDGEERRARAADPVAALEALPAAIR